MAPSLDFTAAAAGAETDEVVIALVTITHAGSGDVGRVSSDNTVRLSDDPLLYGTVSRGQTFYFVPFELTVPDSQDEAPPQARLVLREVTPALIALIRASQTPAEILIELVLASEPDTLELAFPVLEVSHATYDAGQLTLQLQAPRLTQEGYPLGSFTPSSFPALFA
jgi:hypothetical protein